MKFTIFLTIAMVIFSTIEVQGNAEQGADNRKIWFGEKMDEVLNEINNERNTARPRKTPVTWGSPSIKNAILNSGNLRDLFKADYNREKIVGNEQLEVRLSGSSYSKLSRYAGKYTMNGDEKKNNRHVWVKQPGGQAIWFRGEGKGWRIGSIREKDRNTDNTAFKLNGNGNDPIPANREEWEFRLRNNVYDTANGIISPFNGPTTKIVRDLLFNRRSLQQHVANFRASFEGLINGRDKVVTCIQAYNNYHLRPTNSYNCGDNIPTLARPCGGNGATQGGIISINNLTWLGSQLPRQGGNDIQAIVKNWISDNSPTGQPYNRRKVELTTTGSHNGNAGGSLNMKDQLRDGIDLKAHFYLNRIPA